MDCIATRAGHVDGLHQGAVIGWVENGTSPNCVLVETDLGFWDTFNPHLFRGDVVRTRGSKGKHGFAIPLGILPRYKQKVRFYFPDGTPVPGGDLELPRLSLPGRGRRILFIHIPKTAGTSLRALISQQIGLSELCLVYEDEPETISRREFCALPISQRAYFRLVMGHVFSDLASEIPGARLAIMLRDPIARLKSEVLFHLRLLGPMVLSPNGSDHIVDVVNEGSLIFADNLQTRMLASVTNREEKIETRHADWAIQNLISTFDFVGRVETIDQEISLFTQALGLKSEPLGRENSAPAVPDAKSQKILSEIDWRRVEDRHAADFMLYDWAAKNSDWLNRRVNMSWRQADL